MNTKTYAIAWPEHGMYLARYHDESSLTNSLHDADLYKDKEKADLRCDGITTLIRTYEANILAASDPLKGKTISLVKLNQDLNILKILPQIICITDSISQAIHNKQKEAAKEREELIRACELASIFSYDKGYYGWRGWFSVECVKNTLTGFKTTRLLEQLNTLTEEDYLIKGSRKDEYNCSTSACIYRVKSHIR